ncbi:MAG TPA: universal stress protein [Gemmataceae bacterium]|nr:universal stress protein [Gemmataceae bacterium]
MLAIRAILHPTDFSDNSRQAFDLACSLARDHRARLIVVHVLPEPRVPLGGIMTPPPAEDYPEARKQLAKIKVSDHRIQLDRRLAVGDPVTEICRLARNAKCRLIVMGTHGQKGLNRFLMGSVAEQVVRKADCPVLTVRLPILIRPRQRTLAKV